MNSILRNLGISETETSPSASGLLGDDFSESSAFDPVQTAPRQPTEEDPIAVMRKIFVGGQVDDLREQMARLEKQVLQLREAMNRKVQEVEQTLREDIAKVTKAAADALQAQGDSLTNEIEQSRATLASSVDDRFRKLSATTVPRAHLAEVLRDLSSRLQPASVSGPL